MSAESHSAEAATWAARLDAGPLTRAEAQALTNWLDADPGNERRLEEMQVLQQKVRRVLPTMAAAGKLSKPRPAWRRPALAWAGAMAAVLAVGIFWLMQRAVTFTTGPAQRQVVTLADGTKAELNARTTLRVRMHGAERRVQLVDGEVFLTVAKNAAQPFVATTAAGQVRVTGTVFNLRTDAPDSFGVVLLEGGVEATPAGGLPRQLVPGDELVVTRARAELRRLDAAALADVTAWREGRIVFHETPLNQALARFARHHARQIEVAGGVQNLTLGGRFLLDDLDGFLRDLPVVLPVSVVQGTDGAIRVGPAPEGK